MNLQYYKQNVSIIQLVETLGYTYNRNKGRHPKQYEHPDGDKVIIYDKAKSIGESYFTRNKHDDKGSVVDFVKNRLSMFNVHYNSEWEGVLKVLSEFSGSSFDQNIRKPVIDRKSIKAKEDFNSGLFEVKNARLKDLSYLSFERKLNEETLNKFLPYIQTVRRGNSSFTNIGFPYRQPGSDSIQGYELVNFHFKGHALGSQRKDAVWVAYLSSAPQLINQVYIAESAIDAMSFYQLYKHKFKFDQAVFISTGGNVLRNQAEQILNAYPKAKINTLFDNDFSGKLYDIFLAGIKSKREIRITRESDAVVFQLEKGNFKIPIDQLSLSRFERATGIRSGIRPFKADGKDFNEMLQKRSGTHEKLKTTIGPRR
jgi:hypothetical protein